MFQLLTNAVVQITFMSVSENEQMVSGLVWRYFARQLPYWTASFLLQIDYLLFNVDAHLHVFHSPGRHLGDGQLHIPSHWEENSCYGLVLGVDANSHVILRLLYFF